MLAAQSDPMWWAAVDDLWGYTAALASDEVGAWLALTHGHHTVRFLIEERVATDLDASVEVLLVQRRHLADAAFQAIQAWVEAGGTLVLVGQLPTHDAFGQPAPARDAWLGGPHEPIEIPLASYDVVLADGTTLTSGQPRRRLASGTPLATYGDGGSAIVELTRGAGRVRIVGLPLGLAYLEHPRWCGVTALPNTLGRFATYDGDVRRALLDLVGDVPRIAWVDDPLVEVVPLSHPDGARRTFVLVRYDHDAAPVTLTVPGLAGRGHAVFADADVDFDDAGRARVPLGAVEVVSVELPAPVADPDPDTGAPESDAAEATRHHDDGGCGGGPLGAASSWLAGLVAVARLARGGRRRSAPTRALAAPLAAPFVGLFVVLALAAHARAEPPSPALAEAYRGWLDTTGLAERVGYARDAEDREAAQAIVAGVTATRPALTPRAVGATWGWFVVADSDAPAGHCGMAALELAFDAWRQLAARRVLERPVGAALGCRHTRVEVTFRDPARAAAVDTKLDVLTLVQRDTASGAVVLEVAAPFPHAAAAVAHAEGAYGLSHEVELLRAHRYALGARVLGPERVLPVRDDVPLRSDTVSACWHEPYLFPGIETACAITLPHALDLQCASAGWLAFVLEQLAAQRGGMQVDAARPMALAFTCAGGQHGLVRSLAADAAEVTFTGAGAEGPTWSMRVPLDVTVDTRQETWRREQFVAARREAKRLPAATSRARLAWLDARLPIVGAWFGASPDEEHDLGELDLARVASDLTTGPAKIDCAPRAGAPLRCRAAPAVELSRVPCAALAWGLAAGLPHLSWAPFGPRAEVDLEVTCGPARDERVRATRRVHDGRLDITIVAPAGEAPARVHHMTAPIDPARPAGSGERLPARTP